MLQDEFNDIGFSTQSGTVVIPVTCRNNVSLAVPKF